MAIAIDGTGSITGISAGGLPDGTVDTDVLAANAVTEAKIGADEQKGLAKAWVNFNGTGTVAIRSSYNVASLTDNGTGDYTIAFTTAMSDVNYCCQVSAGNSGSNGQGAWNTVYDESTNLVGSTRLTFYTNTGSANQDQKQAFFTVFGN